ncbi:sugar transferase [Sunxiuqinia sp. A32]|uniref:sugar transferase n=1 Tax=Sunxiuqinia sp. A32 TaxID=3461496 RepID=UPI0040460F82
MLKERETVISKISVVLQVLITIFSFAIVWWLQIGIYGANEVQLTEFNFSIIIVSSLWFILLDQTGNGNLIRMTSGWKVFKGYFRAISIGLGFLFAINILLQYSALSIVNLILFTTINIVFLNIYRYLLQVFVRYFRRKGYNSRNILLIADNESKSFIDLLIRNTDWGYRIWAIMTNSSSINSEYGSDYRVIIPSKDLKDILDHETIDEVIYCKSQVNHEEISRLIADCSEIGVGFHHQTNVAVNSSLLKSPATLFSQLPFVSYRTSPNNYLALKTKAMIDFFFSLFVIILTFPFLAIIALAIKLDDGGPIFFKQERVGLNGRRFYVFKFRTMVADAEALKAQLMGQNEQEGPVFKIAMDPRVTRIGRFLRKTSLDELPQFLNVLRGEMSVVGPRPPIPSEVEMYERWQIRRLSVKPGITCIWQVSGRNNIKFEEWMKLDMKYIDNWSIKLDFILVFKTIRVMLIGDGH